MTFRPLAPALADPVALVWKRDRELSRIAQRFLSMMKQTIKDSE
ncbi:fhu operon transcription regulator [Lacticaseibacillus paracasei subsp. paracasei Lpp48]|nr:fhu operon transcription regulator [Lacticaseibacillus paracasei subsp. paracasei Lpp48]